MDNEDVIREQMENTRTSLSEKLETLEQQVATTVQDATSNVAGTVEAVKETVEAVKDSVTGTVEAVKDTVQDTVATVKESVEETISTVKETVHESWSAVKNALDLPEMVRRYPWPMFGGSVALGFVLERLIVKPTPRPFTHGTTSRPLPPDHFSGEDHFAAPRPPSTFAKLIRHFEPEINQLKGLALGALMSAVRDLATKMAPENMSEKLAGIFDSVTQKLGGEQLERESASGDRDREHLGNGRHSRRSPQEV
jgi:hypothetical protein